jgi:hypothetical protein
VGEGAHTHRQLEHLGEATPPWFKISVSDTWP